MSFSSLEASKESVAVAVFGDDDLDGLGLVKGEDDEDEDDAVTDGAIKGEFFLLSSISQKDSRWFAVAFASSNSALLLLMLRQGHNRPFSLLQLLGCYYVRYRCFVVAVCSDLSRVVVMVCGDFFRLFEVRCHAHASAWRREIPCTSLLRVQII
jgi:hypothetical protein